MLATHILDWADLSTLSHYAISNLNATIQLFTSTQLSTSLNRYKYMSLEELIFPF